MQPPTACVVIDGFLVAVERQADPALRGRPVAVGGRTLVAVSSEARSAGVEPGQSPAEARRWCRSLAIVPGQIEAHQRTVARIDAVLRDSRCRREWRALDELYVAADRDTRPDRHLSRTLEHLMTWMARDLGFDVSCGVATTRVAARAAARLGAPRGLVQVLPGYDARFLSSLDIEWLEGIGPLEASRLREAGISTIGALPACDPRVAVAILGRAAPVFVKLAAGSDDRTVVDTSRRAPITPKPAERIGLAAGVARRRLGGLVRVGGAAR